MVSENAVEVIHSFRRLSSADPGDSQPIMLGTKKQPQTGANGSLMSEPPPRVEPDDPAAMAVRSALDLGVRWLHANEPDARAGKVDGVHHLRTTTRRLRTALGLFRGLIEPTSADTLADELKWLAGLLGHVRDLDVLTDHFWADAEDCGTAQALAPLFDTLRTRHAAATAALREALGGERYQRLSGRLADSANELPLLDAAWAPCREALPPLVDGVWKRLKRAGRALTPESPDDDFHEVRKRAKRARYAADAVRDALDPDTSSAAKRFSRHAQAVQDVLGAHQDAVVAAAEIRQIAAAHSDLGPFNFAAGQLLEREQRTAAESREAVFKIWNALDRKKNVRWVED